MVDIHTHILANVDDGPRSIDQSVKMLEIMIKNGVKKVVATPHFDFDGSSVESFLRIRNRSLTALKEVVKLNNFNIEILKGAEVMFNCNLSNQDLSKLTIEGTDYILIELPIAIDDPSLEINIKNIVLDGYVPIIAHLERYSYLINNTGRIVDLINIGAIMQINASTYNSRKNNSSLINTLIRKGLIHVVASDSHDNANRKPNLFKRNLSSEFIMNQRNILMNKTLSISKPKKIFKVFGKYF